VLLLAPIQITFGVCAALLGQVTVAAPTPPPTHHGGTYYGTYSLQLRSARPHILRLPSRLPCSLGPHCPRQEVSGTIIPRYYPERSVILGSLMGTLVSFTAGIGVLLRSRSMRGVVPWAAPHHVPPHARPGVPLTAGVLQIPTKLLRARVGRVPLMLVGLLAFVALALLILLLSPAQIGRFTALVPIYLLQGLGRSCFEGTNKALHAHPNPDPNPNPNKPNPQPNPN
jgi:hypothetical protein